MTSTQIATGNLSNGQQLLTKAAFETDTIKFGVSCQFATLKPLSQSPDQHSAYKTSKIVLFVAVAPDVGGSEFGPNDLDLVKSVACEHYIELSQLIHKVGFEWIFKTPVKWVDETQVYIWFECSHLEDEAISVVVNLNEIDVPAGA